MMILNKGLHIIKKVVKRWFTRIIDLRDKEIDTPLILSLPRHDRQDRILLNIPVERCRTQIWNTLEADKNPFVKTIVDYKENRVTGYKLSAIEDYYAKYQPK